MHVSFTIKQLSQLRPGQVLYQRYDEKADDDRDVIVPKAQFAGDPGCSRTLVALEFQIEAAWEISEAKDGAFEAS